MNPQERDQLTQFLKPLSEFKLTAKDAEAEALIAQAVARQPDAAYLLVQRAMLQDQALNAAKAQIAELQNQLQNTPQRGGFLQNDPWAQPSGAGIPGAGSYQPPRTAAMPSQASSFGGGSSFLGNIATTAAGVVAGSFLFQGIESLLGQHGSGFGGSAWGNHNGANELMPEQTVINNYYGDDAIQTAQADDNRNDYLVGDDSGYDADAVDDSDSDWI
ncbi:hypothetical protein BJL95_10770 [Methylomonas sp. LWB]|uniref:DUF2076 domain-containing protein n=1 Tax=Methylomonas sp. LWB TaxID=1905845 RepID=UPI0008DAB132|nr:DUF2076 family protein [Methylomonas sp. LWB]OHX36253.1 hypothetical protein BJL95_10770 [Methylomonas sp. LWB]